MTARLMTEFDVDLYFALVKKITVITAADWLSVCWMGRG
jgi:hypothetical protein